MSTIQSPRIVSREEWLDARKALQTKEKELTRLRDRLAAERRALPWVKVEKAYVFDAPQGKVTLADLFERRSQLFGARIGGGLRTSTTCCRSTVTCWASKSDRGLRRPR